MGLRAQWARLLTWFSAQRDRVSITIAVVCVAVFVLGLAGWMTSGTDDSGRPDFWTASYLSLGLFVIEGSAASADISPALAWARFLAPLATASAILAIALRVAGSQINAWRAGWHQGHTVVLGSGPEATEIARRARVGGVGGQVVCIGEFSASDTAELRREGVTHLLAADEGRLRKVLRRAARVVITAPDDKQAHVLTEQAREAANGSDASVLTLLSDRDLAGDWRRTAGNAVVCRSAQIATAVLREHAPYAEDAVTPAPIVIGDGDLAAGITRRIIEGWQRPGERRMVHCAGLGPAWAQRAGIGLEAYGRVEWHELWAGAAMAPEVVRAMLDEWQAFKPERYREAPARVYVAYSDDTLTWPIANAIARELPGRTQVVAVVDEERQSQIQMAGMVVVGRTDLLCDPAHLWRTLADDLADEIVADLARWREDSPSAFGPIVRPRGGQETSADRTPGGHTATLAGQTTAVRDAINAVARDAVAILGDAGFEAVEGFTARPEVQFPDPDELRVMADRLRALLPTPPESVPVREQHLRLIELANALPTLLRRVGQRVVRTDGRPDPMSAEAIWDLARGAHKSYTDVAKATRNATGSRFADATWDELTEHERRSNVAQILDVPVKLATLGLSLAALPDVGGSGSDASGVRVREHAFTDGEVELLAEQEHRRWAHFEIRNGRQDHEWNTPWDAIKDTPVADYDRDAVRRIPQYLAYAGLRMVAPSNRGPLPVMAVADTPTSGDASAVVTHLAASETTPVEHVEDTATWPTPKRFARRGRAWAWRLDEPFDWNSPRGHHLVAQAGDWWVIGEDGSSRTVDPASFAATYEQVDAQEYRRVGFVTAVEATERQMVPTREGDSIADPGDWIVTDARGTTWPVPRAVFEALYEPEMPAGEA